jgi:hypothetical protein
MTSPVCLGDSATLFASFENGIDHHECHPCRNQEPLHGTIVRREVGSVPSNSNENSNQGDVGIPVGGAARLAAPARTGFAGEKRPSGQKSRSKRTHGRLNSIGFAISPMQTAKG